MISGLAIARRQFWEKIVEAGDEGKPRENIWIHKCVIVEQVGWICVSVETCLLSSK